MKIIKVFLVDDHEIFLAGLKFKLAPYAGEIEIVGTATSVAQAFELLDSGIIPDVILMDYNLPGENGIDVALKLRENASFRNTKCIILSAYTSHYLIDQNYDLVCQALDDGIEGYLLKDSSIEDIVSAIHAVAEGDTLVFGETIDLLAVNKVIFQERRRRHSLFKKGNQYGLSTRQIEILQQMAKGFSAREIAGQLNISEEAVTNHKDNIKLKLDEKYGLKFRNVVELIVWAVKNKVINA